MGRIEGAQGVPGWILKYKTGIEKGGLKLEDILKVENKIREKPIKIATVSQVINAMGHSTSGLKEGEKREKKKEEEKEKISEKIVEEVREGTPSWILKYRRGIDEKKLAIEDILEMENKIREKPIKIATVSRAINAMGYRIKGLRKENKGRGKREKKKEKEEVEKREILKEVAYTSSIGEISKETEKRFLETKKNWEKDLGKSLPNDYFLNILIILAKLVEHKKTLKMA